MSPAAENGDARAERGGLPRGAMGRVGSLVTSVMDLHVRIALQEADREKRRLISGALLLSGGLVLLLLALIAAEVALLLWLPEALGWSWIHSALALATLNLVLAGLFLRIGGLLTKGPYLPQTTAGLSKTTRALLGR
ncbi:MAG: phage holin family protein [Cyanobacteria bacterium J06638_7]